MKKKRVIPQFEFREIAVVRSIFNDRFGVPRQPGLVSEARGVIKFHDEQNIRNSLRTIEKFSHVWIIFVFHERGSETWRPSIRPPRLGGAQRVGVLASRSPHRPNPIGMSACEIVSIDLDAKGGAELTVAGVDLLDGTPVLDIKPYIPYADSIPHANPGWAAETITRTPVSFEADGYEDMRLLITQLLELDPRPAFQKRQHPPQAESSWGRQYGLTVGNIDVQYEIRESGFVVISMTAKN